jgi:putative nucleotidyltransferase with HDIG domain
MNLLIVDDDQATLSLLENKAVHWGHTVFLAQDGRQAWDMVQQHPIEIIISDWLMPELNGLELCRKIRTYAFDRYIYMIIISSQDTRKDIVEGLEAGADDFITKPINLDELCARIDIGVRVIGLEQELKRRYTAIENNYYQTIRVFSQLIETYDESLGGHCRRVSHLARKLAQAIPEVAEEDYQLIETAALLHDIGMIGLPNGVLSKARTEMNSEEQQLYRSHSVRGEIILNEIELLKPVARIVRKHHEQFNGRGFPDGIQGQDLSISAQIVSAASIYDNFVHRGGISLEEIPEKLRHLQGYQLSPGMVELLLEHNLAVLQEEENKDYEPFELDQLEQGMLLARDVRMKTGAIVMAANTKLTAYGIEKLKQYLELTAIPSKVFILKASARK